LPAHFYQVPEAEAKPEEQAPEQNGETAPENNDDKAS
jgi:hypothetical protein